MAFEGTKTLAEQIVNQLIDRIIRSEVAPGERIFEAKLATEMGVSRSPVREAFRMLEKSRLIEVLPHKGARVTEISPASLRWLFDLIEEFHVLLARKCAEIGRAGDYQGIRKALQEMLVCAEAGDSMGYYRRMFEFSYALRGVVQNPMLNDLLKDLEPNMARMLFLSVSRRGEDLLQNVRMVERIVQGIEEKDVHGADQATRTYVQHERELALRALSDNRPEEKEG